MLKRVLRFMPFRKLKWLMFSVIIFMVVFIANISRNGTQVNEITEGEQVYLERYVLETENDKSPTKDEQACVHPTLDIWHPSLKSFFKTLPPLKCAPEKNWVYVLNGTLRISEEAVKNHGEIKCSYKSVLRGNDDFKVTEGKSVDFKNGDPLPSDFFRVKCNAADKKKYENVQAGIARKKDVVDRDKPKLPDNAFGLNVLMFGFDSVSHMTWMRNFQETYKYFTETLGGVVLDGYNIVGDGTPQALLPILTGKTEWELPEARKGKAGAKPVDGHPFIWKDFQKNGYATMWGEGMGYIGVFATRMKGFNKQPVDHYMRPYYLLAEKEYKKHPEFCLGSDKRHQIMMDYNREFFETYPDRLKFSYIWHAEYTHGGYSEAQYADLDLKEFLQGLERDGTLNKTLLILLSDHGARYQDFRDTVQGKYEERMPYMSLRLPPWFETKYPDAMKNLRTNVKRLTVPFDIYETLYDVLHYRGAGLGDIKSRGISLFKEIPKERECSQAGVEQHWCACLKWQTVNVTNARVIKAAESLLNAINEFTNEKRNECELLSLDSITSAVLLAQNQQVLKFKKSADPDGRKPDLSDKMVNNDITYQVTIRTQPNNGLYEATVSYKIKEDTFTVNDRAISRINKYGNQPHCIFQSLPSIRPYCLCKDKKED